MRDFLDAIFEVIGAPNLTDPEYATVDSGLAQDYTQSIYDALVAILQSRESVSSTVDRLTFYFKARGASLTEAVTAVSNVYIGGEV